jgi:hypothetical protein
MKPDSKVRTSPPVSLYTSCNKEQKYRVGIQPLAAKLNACSKGRCCCSASLRHHRLTGSQGCTGLITRPRGIKPLRSILVDSVNTLAKLAGDAPLGKKQLEPWRSMSHSHKPPGTLLRWNQIQGQDNNTIFDLGTYGFGLVCTQVAQQCYAADRLPTAFQRKRRGGEFVGCPDCKRPRK